MRTLWIPCLLLCVAPAALTGAVAAQGAAAEAPAPPAIEGLDDLLEPLRAEHGLPALAALIVSSDAVLAEGAIGVRSLAADEPVTTADCWHLGSCTKSMTATHVALLVQRGDLSWETTIGDVYPELAESGALHADWVDVPIEWLLQNRGGAPHALDADGLWGRLWKHEGTPTEQRRTLVEAVLAGAPEVPPDTRYVYSNAGFSIAAAMAEEVTGEAWEDAIARDLFEPLGMTSNGFGAPGTRGAHDQPLGHRVRLGFVVPVELGPGDDNPSAIAPAGKVHLGLRDWGRYAALHLRAGRGADPLLTPEAFRVLHAPQLNGYAMGWMQREWDGVRGLWHNGSNGMWYCEIALIPELDLAALVATNRGDQVARTALADALAQLLGRARELAER